jgi:hypothetical protein
MAVRVEVSQRGRGEGGAHYFAMHKYDIYSYYEEEWVSSQYSNKTHHTHLCCTHYLFTPLG